MVVVSVVSHGQNALARPLISQVLACPEVSRVILTCNVPDADSIEPRPGLEILNNAAPRGFGANHNAAFRHARRLDPEGASFCVLNPDIALSENPFPILLSHLTQERVGLAAPRILSPEGRVEDSARDFPTLFDLAWKALGLRPPARARTGAEAFQPDWVAGMFMLLSSRTFEDIGGFDEAFHLYYEDVDLCARLRQLGKEIVCDTRVSVIHDARRDSHRKIKYLAWHIASMSRYFSKQRARNRATGASAVRTIYG